MAFRTCDPSRRRTRPSYTFLLEGLFRARFSRCKRLETAFTSIAMTANPKGIIQKPRTGRNPKIPPRMSAIPTRLRRPIGMFRWVQSSDLAHIRRNLPVLFMTRLQNLVPTKPPGSGRDLNRHVMRKMTDFHMISPDFGEIGARGSVVQAENTLFLLG